MNTEITKTAENKDFKGIEELSDIFGLSVSETIEKLRTELTSLDEDTDEFNEIKELAKKLNPLAEVPVIDEILEQIKNLYTSFDERIENLNQERDANNKFYRVYKSMLYDIKYTDTYMFYANLITQCRIKFTDSVPTLGVYFDNGYNLAINLKFIERYSDNIVMGLLKHEMLHILGGHLLGRLENRKHRIWNYATDCSINQLIETKDLPNSHVSLKTIKDLTKNQNLEKEKQAEYYYDFLEKEDKNNQGANGNDGGNGNGNGNGSGNDNNESNDNENNNSQENKEAGTHNVWNKNKIPSDDLAKAMTREAIKKALDATKNNEKGRGSIPANIIEILDLFHDKAQLNWKQLLRRYQGIKKIDKRQSILKVNRRFMNRDDLRGKISNKTFTTSVIVDVSGSIADEFIYAGLSEIYHICKLTNSSLKVIQVDTEVKKVSDFDRKTKVFERSGKGGTYLYPGIQKAKELDSDVIIVITDGYIESVKDSWTEKPKHVIFLLDNNNVKIDYDYPQYYIKSFYEK